MDFTIPEEYKQLQALARRFVREELLPLEKEIEEKGDFPHHVRQELRKKAKDLGLWALRAPVEYGGGGISEVGNVLVREELGRVSMVLGSEGYIVGDDRCMPLLPLATQEQREKYFLPVIRGQKESCIALTEPDAGSDAAAIKTRALQKGANYVLNGTKLFISMADVASFALVYAVTDPSKGGHGITCFIADLDTPGFSIQRNLSLLGHRGMRSSELVFSDCVVPAHNILGDLGQGLSVGLRQLAVIRLNVGAQLVGVMERVLEMSKDYAKRRVTFGKPLAERQAIQWMLVDTAIDVHATRMMTYEAAWQADQGMDIRTKSALVKLYASQAAFRAADNALQVFGGIGYTKELPIEMIWRDVRLYRIGDGGDEIMKILIAKDILAQ